MCMLTDKDNAYDFYEKKFVNGVYKIEGSEQFVFAFKLTPDDNNDCTEEYVYKMKVYQEPNSERVTMLNVDD